MDDKQIRQRVDTHINELRQEYDVIANELKSNIEDLLNRFNNCLKQQCDQFTNQYTGMLNDIQHAEQEQERIKQQLMDLVQLLNNAFSLLSHDTATSQHSPG